MQAREGGPGDLSSLPYLSSRVIPQAQKSYPVETHIKEEVQAERE